MYSIRKKQGFTIVELLIVIVVIAILATISIVAYQGIQNRAYDAAIKSDLAGYAKLVQLRQTESGRYLTTFSHIQQVGFKPSRDAYSTSFGGSNKINLLVCYDADTLGLFAVSKSGKQFAVGNGGLSVKEVNIASTSGSVICSNLGSGAGGTHWGYDENQYSAGWAATYR